MKLAGLGALRGGNFRQLPHPRHQGRMFGPLHQENRAVAMIERVADIALLLTNPFLRQLEMSSRSAESEHRTGGTSRLAGQAHGRAQLHHGLVEIARTLAAEQGLGSLPESLRRSMRLRRRAPARVPHFRPPRPRARQKQCWRWPPPYNARRPAERATPEPHREISRRAASRWSSQRHASCARAGNIPAHSRRPALPAPAQRPVSAPWEIAAGSGDSDPAPPKRGSAAT